MSISILTIHVGSTDVKLERYYFENSLYPLYLPSEIQFTYYDNIICSF